MQVDKASESSFPIIGCVVGVLTLCVITVVLLGLAIALTMPLSRGGRPPINSTFEEIDRAIEAANGPSADAAPTTPDNDER